MHSQKLSLLLCGALLAGSACGQGILGSISSPDKAVSVTNQILTGTWLLQLNRPGASAPVLNLITYLADGTAIATNTDPTQTTNHGVWLRVGGDRKFLQTMFVFALDANRVAVSVSKVRINVEVSLDGMSVKGTTEVVVMDLTGKVLATIPGGTYTGVRLSPEVPADFYDFQKVPAF